jgi:hypothetical protein
VTDAGYVISGWVITAAAVGGYLARVWVRSRRARRLLGATPVALGGGAGAPADAAMSRQAKSQRDRPEEGDGWR